jgi:sarcosine oxidase subunit alpha
MAENNQKNMTVTARDSASIDSQTPVSFTFDGRKYQGCKGDTLASALLANNVHLTGRSFKYHRPRGIMGAGAEEPNALVGVGTDGRIEPNLKATQVELYDGLVAVSQNRFPSLKLDVGEINSVLSRFFPAGFYYKTFMWPASFWMMYEHIIRHAAGLGKAGDDHKDPDRYEKRHAHFEIVIIGGGLSGLMAGLQAAKSGQRVLIAEDQPQWGGWLRACEDIFIDGMSGQTWAEQAVSRLQAMENVTLLSRTTCFGYGDHNFLTLAERVSDHLAEKPAHLPRQRLWKIRARQVILATGAIERPLVFAGNDLPGVMLASAAQTYLCQYGVLAGTRGILMTNNDAAWYNAFALHRAGCLVKVIVDTRRNPSPALIKQATELGIQTRLGSGIIAAHGRLHIARVEIAPLNEAGDALTGEPEHFDCDLVMMSGGMNPVVHLHSQARGKLKWDERSHCFCPSTTHEAEQSVGSCNGSFDSAIGAKEAIAAARKAIKANLGEADEIGLPEITAPKIKWTPMPVWQIPTGQPAGQGGKAFVDFQNDVTANDIQLAVREGYHSVEHVKRYTTTGMATDQGKTSNINALAILARERASDIPSVGTTTFRMPYSPTSIGMIAGRDIGGLFDPVRTTPMDKWHRAAGAKFEHVGQWMRAWYYPRDGETMQEAVTREVEAARQYAGLLDASTLGKIDIRGRDAAEFLNRIYTNSWLKLGIGKCRYGLMCKDDGMVMDDGVTTRLAEDHFHMTTTTGGAAGVLDWLEEWLQTEWPDLQVYLTSVTEQWAVATLSGPAARDILKAAGTDIDLGDKDFGFMSMREGYISGLPARIYRISFTGDLSYEINVPARYGMALWTSLMRAGRDFGITPYGTEAMHLLRAEKGFIIVGQETDGTVTPYDLGMNWIVSDKKPDFVGKRALARQSMGLGDRKQLVGLRTKDPKQVIPEGAHAVLDPNQPPPVDMLGHVTSSYFSPTLGHSIAMALLRGGHARKGETVYFPMLDGSAPIEATITDTNFYDPKGERLNG